MKTRTHIFTFLLSSTVLIIIPIVEGLKSEKDNNKLIHSYLEQPVLKQLEIKDTLFFDFDIICLDQKNVLFEKLYPGGEPSSLDTLIIQRIQKDKNHYSRKNKMSIFNQEYTNDSLLALAQIGKIKIDSQLYYYFLYENYLYSCYECPCFLSLYSVDSKSNKATYIFSTYQSSNDPSCFGDYNNDNVLDYVHWSFSHETVELYNIQNKKLRKNHTYFLKLNYVDLAKYMVDVKNSNWYCPLN